jgi:hypothetical protein
VNEQVVKFNRLGRQFRFRWLHAMAPFERKSCLPVRLDLRRLARKAGERQQLRSSGRAAFHLQI